MELFLPMIAIKLRLRVIPIYLLRQISLLQVGLESQRLLICQIMLLFMLDVITDFNPIYIFI